MVHTNAHRHMLRILAVGDGDFSCSLALVKAYPSLIESMLVTTLLPSENDLIATYPHAGKNIKELQLYRNIRIEYGMDAMNLYENPMLDGFIFDLVLFHHPHLGYEQGNQEEKKHESLDDDSGKRNDTSAKQHSCLVAHYLHSAASLLNKNRNAISNDTRLHDSSSILPCVHLCLCGESIAKWKLLDSANRLGLHFVWGSPFPASSPPLEFYEKCQQPRGEENDFDVRSNPNIEKRLKECKRGKRKGHWLGRYGYRHQPTNPSSTKFTNSNISNSYHIFLKMSDTDVLPSLEKKCSDIDSTPHNKSFCPICLQCFQDPLRLKLHFESPLLI